MRTELRDFLNQKLIFEGTVKDFGKRTREWNLNVRWEGTVILTDVKNSANFETTHHTWVIYGQRMRNAQIKINDRIKFCAWVREYQRGDGTYDYGLFNPSQVEKIE